MISLLDNVGFSSHAPQALPERQGLPSAAWMRTQRVLAERLEKLRALPRGWDSYAAKPISDTNLQNAELLLSIVMYACTPLPSIVPTKSGGVQIEWHDEGIDFEVRTQSSLGFSVYYFEEATDTEWEVQVGSDWACIKSVVDEITRRHVKRNGG